MMATVLRTIGQSLQGCIRVADDASKLLLAHGVPTTEHALDGAISLALLGQYNSGKSTLVNALLGERCARTGDSPETRKCQRYEVASYEILDLPGGEARVEEQREALAALDEAHAVLYVVSSTTGLDYETLWRDLQLLRDRRIPYLLVVNDKQAHESNDEARAYMSQVLSAFQERVPTKLGSEGPSVFWVQAAFAEKGRLEGKPALVDLSGIVPLEHALVRYVAANQATLRDLTRFAPLRRQLEQLQSRLQDSIEDDLLKRLGKTLERCDRARETLAAAAGAMADERFSTLRDAVAATLSRHVTSKDKPATVADEITSLCQGVVDGARDAFNSRLSAELSAIEASAGLGASGKTIPFSTRLGGVPKVEVEAFDPVAFARRAAGLAAAVRSFAKSVGEEAAKQAGKQGARAAAREVAVETVKNTGKEIAERGTGVAVEEAAKTGGRAGGKVLGKAIGPIIVVAVAAWEIWEAFGRARKEKTAVAAALREAEAKAGLAAIAARDFFLSSAHALVASTFTPVRVSLQEALLSTERGQRKLRSDLLQVSSMRDRLDVAMQQLEERTRR